MILDVEHVEQNRWLKKYITFYLQINI